MLFCFFLTCLTCLTQCSMALKPSVFIIAARAQDFEAANRIIVEVWSTSAIASEQQFGCGFICHASRRRHQRWPLGGPCCT